MYHKGLNTVLVEGTKVHAQITCLMTPAIHQQRLALSKGYKSI